MAVSPRAGQTVANSSGLNDIPTYGGQYVTLKNLGPNTVYLITIDGVMNPVLSEDNSFPLAVGETVTYPDRDNNDQDGHGIAFGTLSGTSRVAFISSKHVGS